MEEYLRLLLEEPESPFDTLLATQIRLQLVIDQINQARFLTPLHATALRSKISDIEKSIPADLAGEGK
jgi:hypothetical protein